MSGEIIRAFLYWSPVCTFRIRAVAVLTAITHAGPRGILLKSRHMLSRLYNTPFLTYNKQLFAFFFFYFWDTKNKSRNPRLSQGRQAIQELDASVMWRIRVDAKLVLAIELWHLTHPPLLHTCTRTTALSCWIDWKQSQCPRCLSCCVGVSGGWGTGRTVCRRSTSLLVTLWSSSISAGHVTFKNH